MAKRKTPTLGAIKDDEKAKGKIASALGAIASALGIGGAPAAGYSKHTETVKRTVVKEGDDDEPKSSAPGSEEEEEEAAESTARSGSEEEEEAMDSASDRPPPKSEEEEEEEAADSKEEEEEEKCATAFAASDRAYRKHAKGVDAYAIRGPAALLKACEKATGVKGLSAVLGALAAMPKRKEAAAKVEKDVAALKARARADRIEALVAKAKADGSAPNKDLRASLRVLGQKHGSAFLAAHIATLPKVRTEARVPKTDEKGAPIGAPGRDEQAKMREQAMAGLSEKERETYLAIEAEKNKGANGAGKRW